MDITYKVDNKILTIFLAGELDHHSAVFAKVTIDELLDKDIYNEVIFDFSRMTFMDSTGIGVLLGRYKKLKEHKVPVYARGAQGSIEKLLKLSGIYNIFIKLTR